MGLAVKDRRPGDAHRTAVPARPEGRGKLRGNPSGASPTALLASRPRCLRARGPPHKGARRMAQIRNVALLSHSGAGKTSLTEALLFRAGTIPKMGSIEDGTTASDVTPEEKR